MRHFAILVVFACLLSLCGPLGRGLAAAETSGGAPLPGSNLAVEKNIYGQARIPVRDQASLDLPAGYAFMPEAPARELMRKLGNSVNQSFVGLIFPQEKSDWFIIIEYVPSGHINDDEAKNWKADELLNSVRGNTETENKKRLQEGGNELEVIGWVEPPHYDQATRRLVWSISARNKGSTDDSKNIINYKTLMLGREGYVSMTMVTGLRTIEAEKPIANLMLSRLDFQSGKTYGDFDSKTDRIAEYGLGALIAGVAVKKLGLIAIIVAFAVKFAKIGALAVLGFSAALRRWFRRSAPH